ncbi:MAG: hypothetical protein D3906_02700 [Candidatus Electrothrix sp. AUS1_2]|nr:hypothetical protein [Candidatus Electrothrix sp. AUS1_2]
MLPNFFIAGAPKAGTTTLYRYLGEHRDVFMSNVKEPNFFSYDQIVEQKLYYSEKGISTQGAYEKIFEKVGLEKAVGEASVSYFFYKQVPLKIHSCIPDAKIILILRSPVERSFSHYLMDLRLGYINHSFEDIVYKQIIHPMLILYYQQFIELGFYYEHVKRYFDVFGEQNVKVFLHDDLENNARQIFAELCDFLGIYFNDRVDFTKKYNVYKTPRNKIFKFLYSIKKCRQLTHAIIPNFMINNVKNWLLISGNKPKLSEITRKYLNDLYKKNIYQTGKLIRRDLSGWCND